MELVFCDRCQASIPEAELAAARARGGGGVLCETCAPPAPAPPIPAAAERRSARASWRVAAAIGAGSLLFTVAAVGVLFLRLEQMSAAWRSQHEQLREEFRSIRERDHDIERFLARRVDEAAREIAERAVGSVPARQPAEGRTEAETAAPGTSALPLDEEELRALVASEVAAARSTSPEQGASVTFDPAALAERLDALEERVHYLTTRRIEASQAVGRAPRRGAAGSAPDGTADPLLARLASPEATVRAGALFEIAAGDDPERARQVLPLLRDPDAYVRETAARVLERLGARIAVQHLLDALEDGEVRVREAALAALRGITGQDLYFDPRAAEADRRRALEAWRAWWRDAWKSFLYGETPRAVPPSDSPDATPSPRRPEDRSGR